MATVPTKKPTSKKTTIKALADQGNAGQIPDRLLPVYEFGNGRIKKRAGNGALGHYGGTFNESSGLWEN